jgi:hypothetical protein
MHELATDDVAMSEQEFRTFDYRTTTPQGLV